MIEIPLFVIVLYLVGYCVRLQKDVKKLRIVKTTIILVDREGNRREVNPLNFSCPNKNCQLHGKKGKWNIKKRKFYGVYKDRIWFKCTVCGKEFSETKGTAYFNKKKPIVKIRDIVKYLSEGGEIRKASRIFNVSKDTVLSYLEVASKKARVINKLHHHLKFKFLQFDELWSFIFKKEKNLKHGEESNKGSFYGFISYVFKHRFIADVHNGKRNDVEATKFVEKQKKFIDLSHYVLIMSDGFSSYVTALLEVFGKLSSFYLNKSNESMKIPPKKLLYGQISKKRENGKVVEIVYQIIYGSKKSMKRMLKRAGCSRITTSLIERVNLSLRHHIGRFKRKGMGFSKSKINHEYALAFFQAIYNYATPNRGLDKKITPAMSVGLTKRIWTIDDILRFQPVAS